MVDQRRRFDSGVDVFTEDVSNSVKMLRLSWNSHQNVLMSSLCHLLAADSFVDVTLCCEGRRIRAHRLLLAAYSSLLRELFLDIPTKHATIIIHDARFCDIQALVTLLYSGEVTLLSENWIPFCHTADVLGIDVESSLEKVEHKPFLFTESPVPARELSPKMEEDTKMSEDISRAEPISPHQTVIRSPVIVSPQKVQKPSTSPSITDIAVPQLLPALLLGQCDKFSNGRYPGGMTENRNDSDVSESSRDDKVGPDERPKPVQCPRKKLMSRLAASQEQKEQTAQSRLTEGANLQYGSSIAVDPMSAERAANPQKVILAPRESPYAYKRTHPHLSPTEMGFSPFTDPNLEITAVSVPTVEPRRPQHPLEMFASRHLAAAAASLVHESDRLVPWSSFHLRKPPTPLSADSAPTYIGNYQPMNLSVRDEFPLRPYPMTLPPVTMSTRTYETSQPAFPTATTDSAQQQHPQQPPQPPQTDKNYTCTECSKAFTSRASLKAHSRVHSGEKPYWCQLCNKGFSQLRNYRYHKSLHDGTHEFACTCPICGKTFNDRGYISCHMKIHRNRKEYQCQYCEKRFNQRVAYNMHVRIHTGEKPHQCTMCDKKFSRKMLLKQHIRTHTGERPYKCTVCSKTFADRSNMMLHQRLHTGVKPYSCKICNKSFTKNHHLKTHMNHHTGVKPYACERCGLRFTQSSNMRTHYKKCCQDPYPSVSMSVMSPNSSTCSSVASMCGSTMSSATNMSAVVEVNSIASN